MVKEDTAVIVALCSTVAVVVKFMVAVVGRAMV